jgi:hypothetical protein
MVGGGYGTCSVPAIHKFKLPLPQAGLISQILSDKTRPLRSGLKAATSGSWSILVKLEKSKSSYYTTLF